MCLAVPAKLISCTEDRAVADMHGNRVPICIALVPNVAEGDWVLVHAGFAIQQLSEVEAEKTFAVMSDLAAHDPQTGGAP